MQTANLSVVKKYGKNETKNFIVYGDNCFVCDAIAQDYRGKVKCIYIEIITPSMIQCNDYLIRRFSGVQAAFAGVHLRKSGVQAA